MVGLIFGLTGGWIQSGAGEKRIFLRKISSVMRNGLRKYGSFNVIDPLHPRLGSAGCFRFPADGSITYGIRETRLRDVAGLRPSRQGFPLDDKPPGTATGRRTVHDPLDETAFLLPP